MPLRFEELYGKLMELKLPKYLVQTLKELESSTEVLEKKSSVCIQDTVIDIFARTILYSPKNLKEKEEFSNKLAHVANASPQPVTTTIPWWKFW